MLFSPALLLCQSLSSYKGSYLLIHSSSHGSTYITGFIGGMLYTGFGVAPPHLLLLSSSFLDQILLGHQTRSSHSPFQEASPRSWLQGLGTLLTWHPRVCCSKYSLLGLFPVVPIKGRDIVRPLFEEETEVLIGVWVVEASLWIPIGNA